MVLITAIVGFGTLFILALLGVPLAAAIALGGVIGMIIADIPLLGAPIAVMGVLGNFAWLALPLFIILGGLLSHIGVARGLISLGDIIGRKVRGGISQVLIISSLFMGGMTGSTLAEAGMLSSLFRKDMEALGYPKGYLAGLISCAGLIGALIPPSNVLLILGLSGQISILRLWVAGILPGTLLALGLMIVAALSQTKYEIGGMNLETKANQTKSDSNRSLLYAIPGLSVPIFILGGMRMGIFSPVEAGAAGILFGLLLGFIWFRNEMKIKSIVEAFGRDLLSACGYLLLVVGAAIFGVLIVRLNITSIVDQFFANQDLSQYQFMIINFLIFFIMGFFIEAVPIMLIFFPLMLPAARSIGIDPTHFGISFSMIILLANLTPPVGVQTLFVCRLLDVSVSEWWRHGKFFFCVVLVVTFAVMFFPRLSLTLPELLLN